MKKCIALLLALLMLGGAVVPAAAEEAQIANAIMSDDLLVSGAISNTGDEEPAPENAPVAENADADGQSAEESDPSADPENSETPQEPAAQEEVPVSDNQPVEIHNGGSIPMVTLGGTGADIYDEDGNIVYDFPNIIGAFANGREGVIPDGFDLKESFKTVLKSYVQNYFTFRRQKFYDALEAEVAKLSDRIMMDENGDPRYGTNVSPAALAGNEVHATTPNPDGPYDTGSYYFSYDWRRSPMEVADELDAYIDAVCAMTGKEQIALNGRCLGTNFVLAYLAKYGYKNRICGLGLNVGMMRGQNALSEAISGKMSTDGDAILRYMTDLEMDPDDMLVNLIRFAEDSGILGAFNSAVKSPLYESIVKGVTSALALSTLFTMPGYWSCVSNEDYDDALLYVFGKEGSEKRQKYAGLIEKIEAYHNQVQLPMDEMLRQFTANGGKLAIVCKYGFQLMPMCDSRNDVADTFVSVHNASLGATTCKNYNTLSADYIRSREALGLGKYLSPDKKIDASSCLFPDYTWFIKNVVHDSYSDTENAIIYTVATADVQYTVDDFDCTQFLVKLDGTGETEVIVPMTAENAATEHWEATDPATLTFFDRVARFFESLRRILGDLFYLLGQIIG